MAIKRIELAKQKAQARLEARQENQERKPPFNLQKHDPFFGMIILDNYD